MGHAIDRAKQRWEVELTKDDLLRVAECFRMGDWRLVQVQGWFDGSAAFAARLRGHWIPFVIRRDGYIVTVLRRDHVTDYWRKINAHKAELKRRGIDPDMDIDPDIADPVSRERNAG